MKILKRDIKISWIVWSGIILLIAIGIYANPDRKITDKKEMTNNLNNPKEWVEFTPDDKSFTVSLPKKPGPLPEDQDDTSDIKIQVYVSASQDGQAVYSVRKVDLPMKYRSLEPYSVLGEISFGQWAGSDTSVLEKREGKVNGYDTLDFKVSMNKDGKVFYTTVRSIWDGGSIYEIMTGTKESRVEEYQKVINSFKINHPNLN